jgi:hypothetical protein
VRFGNTWIPVRIEWTDEPRTFNPVKDGALR